MFNLDIKDRAKTLIEIRDLILPDIDKEAWTLSAYLWASGEYGLTLKHGYSKTGYLEITQAESPATLYRNGTSVTTEKTSPPSHINLLAVVKGVLIK